MTRADALWLVAGLILGAFVGYHGISYRHAQIIHHERALARRAVAAGHAMAANPSPSACAHAAARALAAGSR